MEGVILFADDHVFETGRLENKLFEKLNSESGFSILPINNLGVLEKTVSSISTYRALILDWNFNKKSDDEGVKLPDENPFDILERTKIYSLIYIYSEIDIADEIKARLTTIFTQKICFERKINNPDLLDSEYYKILNGITQFEESNTHLVTPYIWSQSINTSVQNIFEELKFADPNWIKEIYQTASKDGAEPNTEVIGIFQNLLAESVIQNDNLTKSISTTAALPDIAVTNKEESLAKLYHRIYYTKVLANAPLMTGDIFRLSEVDSAILITPECDIKEKSSSGLDFIIVKKSSFSDYLLKHYTFTVGTIPTPKQKEKISLLFNQSEIKIHILPSFPFIDNKYNSGALIEFESCFISRRIEELKDPDTNLFKERLYKLNSPYIHQLRQRYLAYNGRVGVPGISNSLVAFNLE